MWETKKTLGMLTLKLKHKEWQELARWAWEGKAFQTENNTGQCMKA